jgi:colanic acid/amylovoran biosynthesis protein
MRARKVKRRKDVHISAYIAGNLGDDLFVKIICERYKNIRFIMAGPKAFKQYFEHIQNLKYISDDTFLRMVICKLNNFKRQVLNKGIIYREIQVKNKLANQHDITVLIGGSLFTETPTRLVELEMEAKWYEQRPLLIGCNFGPYTNENFYLKFKEKFGKARHICFRDQYSYELFKELGHVSYAPDVVFNLKHSTENQGYYVISVMDFKNAGFKKWEDYAEDYLKKIAELVNIYMKNNTKVVLISFCERLGDTAAIQGIIAMTGENKNLEVCEYAKQGMAKALTLMANCEGIIASRFHALVLGIVFKKRVYPVMYSIKMENLLSDLGIENRHYYIDCFVQKDCESIQSDFLDMSNLNVELISKKADKQFTALDKLIKLRG